MAYYESDPRFTTGRVSRGTPQPVEKPAMTYFSSSSSGPTSPGHSSTTSKNNWDDYHKSAYQLVHWLRNAIVELSRREFPGTFVEMKDVASNFTKFRSEEVRRRSQERYQLANLFDDLQDVSGKFPIKREYHLSEIDKLWNEFVLALQEKDSAIHIELSKLQKMSNLASKTLMECNRCNELIDDMESKVMEIKRKTASPHLWEDVRQIQTDVIELFRLMSFDLQKLYEGNSQEFNQLSKSFQCVKDRYINLEDYISNVDSSASSISSPPPLSSPSVFVPQQLQDGYNWLKSKEEEMENIGYGRDLRTSTDCLEMQKKWHQEIKQFQTVIKECIDAKQFFPSGKHLAYNKQLSQLELSYTQLLSTSNFRLANLQSLVSFLKEATNESDWMKMKENETTDSVSSPNISDQELQNLTMLGDELKGRERSFISLLDKGEDLSRDHHPAHNVLQLYCNLLHAQWTWLVQLSNCMEIHSRNIYLYQQFHVTASEVDRWTSRQLNLINELSLKQASYAVEEAEKILKALSEVKKSIRYYENVITSLESQTADIPAIKFRSQSLSQNTKIEAVCSYKLSDVAVEKGEKCILLSDSLSKWKIRNSSGKEGVLPAACFALLPPNHEVLNFMKKIKSNFNQLKDKLESFSFKVFQQIVSGLIQRIKNLTLSQYQAMRADERSLLRTRLDEKIHYLTSNFPKDDSNVKVLHKDLQNCCQILDKFDSQAAISGSEHNASINLLNELNKLMQAVNNLENQIDATCQESFYPKKSFNVKRQISDVEESIGDIRPRLEDCKQKYESLPPSRKTVTLDDMHAKVIEKFDRALALNSFLSQRLEATLKFEVEKSEILAFINDMENLLKKLSCLPVDVSQLKDVAESLQKCHLKLLQNQHLKETLEKRVNRVSLLNSNRQFTTASLQSDVNDMQRDCGETKISWGNLKQKITERKLNVEQAVKYLVEYKGKERQSTSELNDYEKLFDILSKNDDKDVESTEQLVTLFSKVKSFRHEIETLNKHGGLFIKEIQAYEKSFEIISQSSFKRFGSSETVSNEMNSINNRYTELLNNLLAALSSRKSLLERLGHRYLLSSEKELPSLRTFQSETRSFEPGGKFEVPQELEEHFRSPVGGSEAVAFQSAKPLGKPICSLDSGLIKPSYYDKELAVHPIRVDDELPQEEHMHSEDVEEFVQPIKDGEEKITKHTKQEFHSRKTATGFKSLSTHEKKLLSLVSTEALDYSGKIKFPLSIDLAIQYKLFNAEQGYFVHPESCEQMSLKDAIEKSLLDADKAIFVCPTSLKAYPLKDAIESKLLDSYGCFTSLDGDFNFDQLLKGDFIKLKSLQIKSAIKPNNCITKTKKPSETASRKRFYAITSSIDPITKRILDAFSAVQQGVIDQANALYNGVDGSGNVVKIPICDAINLGLVFVDENIVSGNDFRNKLIQETKTFNVTGVIDPVTRTKLTLAEAVNSGYIDQMKGLFNDPIKRKSIPIVEAISLGHVLADVMTSTNDGIENSTKKILTSKEVAFTISSVFNAYNGKEINIFDAIKLGIFDPSLGEYKNLKTGETMSLNEAIEKGFIKIVQGKPEVKETPREEKVSSIHIDDELDAREEMAHEEIIEERKTFQITGVKEMMSGKFITFGDAVAHGIIDEERGLYLNTLTSQRMPVPEALERGFIIGSMQLVGQQELFKSAVVALQKNEIAAVYSPLTDSMVSASEAIQLGLLSRDMKSYFDPRNNKVYQINDALSMGFIKTKVNSSTTNQDQNDREEDAVISSGTKVHIDWSGGNVVNSVTRGFIPISEALKFGLIDDCVAAILRMKNPEKNVEKIVGKKEEPSVSLKMVVEMMFIRDESGRIIIEDESSEHQTDGHISFIDSESSGGLSLYDAVKLGLYNVHKGVYFDPSTRKTLSLKDSINAGIINPSSPAVKDLISGEIVSLNEMMKNNIIDLSSGKLSFSKFSNLGIASDPVFVNSLQRTINLEDAIRCGLFDDELGLFKVPFTDKTLNLKSSIHCGYISGDANVVLNPLNGERLLLSQAVESDVISGETGKFVDSTLEKNITLSKSFIVGLIKHTYQNNCSVVMDWETGELFSLEDCINTKFVNQSVSCVYDPSSNGWISLKSAGSIGLIDTRKNVYVNPSTSDEIPISVAAKLGLISFPGAPILSIPEAATGDITQTHLQTNVSLLKGARLLENITETSSFDDIPPFASRLKESAASQSIKKLSDNPTEVTFEKNEPNKKFFETKTFDTNTDETPVTMTMTKEGNLLSTHKIVGKVQKSQIKETIENHGDEAEFNSHFSSAGSTHSSTPSSKQIAEHGHGFEIPSREERRSSASYVGNVPRSFGAKTFIESTEIPQVPSYRSVVEQDYQSNLGVDKKFAKQSMDEFVEVEERKSPNFPRQGMVQNKWENETDAPQNKIVTSGDTFERGIIDFRAEELHDESFQNESKVKNKITLNDALVKKLLIIPLSKVKHFATGQHLTLEDAVHSGYIDLDRSVIIDPGSSRPRAASELVDSQIFSVRNAVMKNLVSRKLMTLSEMVSQNFIPSYNLPDAEEIQVLTYKEAVLCGFLDEITNQYFEPVTKVIINVETAFRIGYIEHDPLERTDMNRRTHAIPRSRPVPLLDAFKRGYVDPKSFVYTSPSTGEKCHFNNAISRGWIVVPECDGSDSSVEGVDFEAAFRQGYIDITNNIFIDPMTEVLVPLDAAIKKGYVLLPTGGLRMKVLEPDDEASGGNKQFSSTRRFLGFPDLPLQFEDALSCGLYDETSGTFSDPHGGGSLTIEDAVESNLIDSFSKVKNPANGAWMPLETAMRDGHVDSLSGKFINPTAFSAIPTKEAFELGLMKNLGPCTWIGTSLSEYLRKCLESGNNILVFNPLSQSYTSLSHAHNLGIVDLNTNVYYDSTTSKSLTFETAIQQHLLLIDREFGHDQFDVVNFEIIEVYDSLNNKWISPSVALKSEILDTNSNLYIDSSAKEMALFDALKLNKIKVKELDVNSTPTVDRVFSIKRVVDLVDRQEIHPQAADRKGIVDMKNEVYCDFLNKSKIPLYSALLSNLLQAEEVDAHAFQNELQSNEIEEVMDYTTGVKWTLVEAMENKLIDDTMSYYIDPRTGEKHTLRHAWEQGYITLKSDDLHSFQSRTIKSVIDPRTGEEIPISDAVRHQIVDKIGGKFWNMKTNTYMDLDYAVSKGFVLTESTEKAIEKLALVEVDDYLGCNAKVYLINSVRDPRSDKEFDPVEAERRGYINKVQGIYMNPITGEQISIQEAITSGYVRASEVEEPDYEALKQEENVYAVFESNKPFKEISSVVDPSNNEKITLIEGVRRGILDLRGNAKIISNNSQKITNDVRRSERLVSHNDGSYTFKVRVPVFFTVIKKDINYQTAQLTPETSDSKHSALEKPSNQKREVHLQPVSNKPMLITEPKKEYNPVVDKPTTINRQSETSSKSSTRTTPANSSSPITRSYSDHLSSVKDVTTSKHLAGVSEAFSLKQMSSCVAVHSSSDDRNSSKLKQTQKDSSSNGFNNHRSPEISLPLFTSKDDFESLDQLLTELEQGSTHGKKQVDDSLMIDESLLQQPNKWGKQLVDPSISSDTEFFPAREKQV